MKLARIKERFKIVTSVYYITLRRREFIWTRKDKPGSLKLDVRKRKIRHSLDNLGGEPNLAGKNGVMERKNERKIKKKKKERKKERKK